MEPIDREDSSTYINKPQDQPEAPQPVQRVEPPKQKKGRGAAILAFLLFLAIVAVAALGWLWYQQSGRVGNLESDLSSARNNVARLESAAKAEAAIDDSDATIDTDSMGSDAIIKAALAYETALVKPLSGLKAEVAYSEGDYAKVNITSTTTGHYQILKKSNDIWVVIASGNGPLDQEIIDRYAIPAAALK